jgi:hypothetical protein
MDGCDAIINAFGRNEMVSALLATLINPSALNGNPSKLVIDSTFQMTDGCNINLLTQK